MSQLNAKYPIPNATRTRLIAACLGFTSHRSSLITSPPMRIQATTLLQLSPVMYRVQSHHAAKRGSTSPLLISLPGLLARKAAFQKPISLTRAASHSVIEVRIRKIGVQNRITCRAQDRQSALRS